MASNILSPGRMDRRPVRGGARGAWGARGARGAAGAWVVALAAALVAVCACRGPERAEHEPIPGVDAEPYPPGDPAPSGGRSTSDGGETAPPPEPVDPAERTGDAAGRIARSADPAAEPIEALADRIASAAGRDPVVAVFWPLSPAPDERGGRVVNRLGVGLARDLAEALSRRGVDTIAGDGLVERLAASNRGLADYREPLDAHGLGERVGADWVVGGTLEHVAHRRLSREERIDVRFTGYSLLEGREPFRPFEWSLPPGLVDAWRDYRRPAPFEVGARAPAPDRSLDLEFDILARMLVRRILQEAGDELTGERVLVGPVVFASTTGPLGELRVFQDALLRDLESARRRAEDEGRPDALDHVLRDVPVEILGTRYASFGRALDELAATRARMRSTRIGQLAEDLASEVAEVVATYHGDVERALDTPTREALLEVIRDEAEAYREDRAYDPESLAELRARGSDVLLSSVFRKKFDAYELRVSLWDLDDGSSIADRSIAFDPSFGPELDRLLASEGDRP